MDLKRFLWAAGLIAACAGAPAMAQEAAKPADTAKQAEAAKPADEAKPSAAAPAAKPAAKAAQEDDRRVVRDTGHDGLRQ